MSKLFQGAAHCLPAGPSAVVPPPAAWQTHPARDAGPAATPAGGRPLLSQHVAEAGRPTAGSPPRLQGTWTFLRDSPVAPPRRSRARKESEAGDQEKGRGRRAWAQRGSAETSGLGCPPGKGGRCLPAVAGERTGAANPALRWSSPAQGRVAGAGPTPLLPHPSVLLC